MGAKRTAPQAVTASYQEVVLLVKRRRIRQATHLWEFAQKQNTRGDQRLLNYCSGEVGMKKNLQAHIDAIWKVDESICSSASKPAQGGAMSSEEVHLAPLSAAELAELQNLARTQFASSSSSLSNPLQVIHKVKFGGLSGLKNAALQVTAAQPKRSAGRRKVTGAEPSEHKDRSVVLFDHYGHSAEVVFRPRSGIWRLRDFYEVLVACRQDSSLALIAPSSCAEGGFLLPRTEAGWRVMLKDNHADARVPFAELTPEQLASAAPELRFGIECGLPQWSPQSSAAKQDGVSEAAGTQDSWIAEMPQDAQFENDCLATAAAEERLVRLWARSHVEDLQLLAVIRAFQACQHVVVQTKGFEIKKDSMIVQSTKNRIMSHKTGVAGKVSFSLMCASATAAQEANDQAHSRPRKRPLILGGDRSASFRPQLSLSLAAVRSNQRLMSITDSTPSASIEDGK